MTGHTPRSAAALLTDALGAVDLVEPPAAREPIRQWIRSGIEMCTMARGNGLLGLPLNYVLELAQALVDAREEG